MDISRSKPISFSNLDVDTKDGVVTSTELRSNFKELAAVLRQTMRPMVITIEGKSGGVLLAPELWEQVKKRIKQAEDASTD